MRMVFAALMLLLLAAVGHAEEPSRWIKLEAREGGGGARLEITRKDGATLTRKVTADTGLIAYMPQFGIGNRPHNGLDQNGWNRVLLRFDLSDVGEVVRAELVLPWTQSRLALDTPLDVGVHTITAAWRESGTTWAGAPAFEAKPAATLTIDPKTAPARVDVTAAVQAAAAKPKAFHGWLLKSASEKPLPAHMLPGGRRTTGGGTAGGARKPSRAPRMPPRRGAQQLRAILAQVPWVNDAAGAVAKAKAEGKLALAIVRASYAPTAPNDNEEIFCATVLAHPAVATLIGQRFAATRVGYHAATYTIGRAGAQDPLAPLGTSAARVKPLALVVADGTGRHLGTLMGFGTFRPRDVYAWLAARLKDAGMEAGAAWPETADAAEARYHRIAVHFAAGRMKEAQALWTEAPRTDPYQHLVAAWLAWPERMAMYAEVGGFQRSAPEDMGAASVEGTTEMRVPEARLGAFVVRPLMYLLRSQAADGSWPTADGYAPNKPGVTALAGRALLAWRPRLQGKARASVDEALAKALTWCETWMKTKDPAEANSFGTAYVLDFLVDAAAHDPKRKPLAQRAVAFHEAGQAENGGWGYSRRFAERWRGGFGGWPVTDKGRVHSMNTAPSVLALLRAKAAGFKVDEARLARAKSVLVSMKAGPASFTYTWPEPRNFEGLRTSIGRACACEEALLGLGAGSAKDLELAVKTFLEHREDLHRIAKASKGWTPPAAVSSYFKFFAYHHAMRAIRALPEAQRAAHLRTLRSDVLSWVERDGTWVDYLGVGKPYGTAMALLVLATAP